MTKRTDKRAAAVAAAIVLLQACIADAAEIKILAGGGVREVMQDLGPKFERATGHRLAITFATAGAILKSVQGGETADVIFITRQVIDSFVKDGKAAPSNVTGIARENVGVAVRKGAPKPDISTPEALKRALLAAASIVYSDPAGGGVSGVHFAKVLDRLGIANEMKSKTVFVKSGPIGPVLEKGEAEIGVQSFQLLMPFAGIDIVGPLPGDLQATTLFSAAIMAGAGDAEASKALVNFLRSPEAAAVIKAKGMEPD